MNDLIDRVCKIQQKKLSNKEYYNKNRNKRKAYDKEYYIKNRDQILTHRKEYYKANSDRVIAYQSEYNSKPENKIKINKRDKIRRLVDPQF